MAVEHLVCPECVWVRFLLMPFSDVLVNLNRGRNFAGNGINRKPNIW